MQDFIFDLAHGIVLPEAGLTYNRSAM